MLRSYTVIRLGRDSTCTSFLYIIFEDKHIIVENKHIIVEDKHIIFEDKHS